MQQPLIPPRADRSRYDYSIQPTEDREEFTEDVTGGKKPPVVRRPGKAPNYKPKPLTWPFIVGLVVMLCIGIGLIAYAEKALPDSDSDAIIVDSLPSTGSPRRFARAELTDTSVVVSPSSSQDVVPSITSIPSSEAIPTASSVEVPVSSISAVSSLSQEPSAEGSSSQVPSSTISGSASVTSSDPASESSGSSTEAESISGNSGAANRRPNPMGESSDIGNQKIPAPSTSEEGTSLPSNVIVIGTSISRFTSFTTLPESTVTTIVNVTSVRTFTTFTEVTTFTEISSEFTSVIASSIPRPPPPPFGNGTFGTATATSSSPPPGWESVSVTATMTTVISEPVTMTEIVTSVVTVVKPSPVETTVKATIAPVTGEITVTRFSTLAVPPTDPNNRVPPTENRRPEVATKVGTVVIEGTTVEIAETQKPVVTVVPVNQVKTVTNNEQVRVITTQVGGSAVTSFLILTPTPINPVITANIASTVGGTPVTVVTQPDPTTFETVIGGVLQTVVQTPPPQTIVSMVGGTLTTVGQVLTAAAPGQPITFTVVSDVGGTPVTQVVVSTPAGGVSFQPITFSITTNIGGTPTVVTITPPPTPFVTTIDGTPITMVTTPPITSFTTTLGATLTTLTSVTTPTGTGLITITLITTSSGTLTTLTSTLSPGSTFLTTLSSGSPLLTTITSTPSPTTTRFSTRHRSTSTFTSLSTSSPPPNPTPTPPSVIETTRVYKWTSSDIFLGTFLPPLLGVALVIPLRIIDLNAKLYQPFQSLTSPHHLSPGSQTLTMQYTGFMTFVTPVVTLLQGHPVPFLTTLMVLVGSFIVPLATEAIGLKLHGTCLTNTAIKGCGPSLGVSPAPAHALMGLMGVVIVLLITVLVLIGRWATGVHANPWNIAGIASLVVGSREVRVRQAGEGEMKRDVGRKMYGMGFAVSKDKVTGREEEYGIVLADEAGGRLNGDDGDGGEGLIGGGSEGDGLITRGGVGGMTARRGNSANNLPLMPLRYPWRLALIAFQVGLLVFIIYYHVYYHVTLKDEGRVFDDGRLWEFMNANTFGVRFVAAIVGVIIAFCWQSFFLSVSVMAPYQLMALQTQPAERSILFSSSTNAFSGIYGAFKKRHVFLFATSLAAILSEFLPVFLANVFFSLSQTSRTATACAAISSIILGLLIAVLVWSFLVKWPPMPVDPRSIAGMLYYVSQSHMLDSGDFDGVSTMDGEERDRRIREKGRRYFYGVLVGGPQRRLGVDSDSGTGPDLGQVDTAYHGMSETLAEGGRPGGLGEGIGGGGGLGTGPWDMSGGGGDGNGDRSGSGSRGGGSGSGVSALSRIDEAPVLHEHDEGLLASGRNGYGQSFASRMGVATGYDTMGPSTHGNRESMGR